MCCSAHHHGQNQTMTPTEAIELAKANRHRGDNGWCTCEGDDGGPCCGAATDDGLCDRCRTHCKADQQTAAPVAGELEEAMAP